MKPLVSVCMITYNHEKYIAEALNSVLMQKTNFDFEIVIGEDWSTDRTREIVLEYKAKHLDKIKLVLQEKNVGMTSNFYETLKLCSGSYIAICDGDDYWIDENKLQKQIDFLDKNKNYGLIYTDILIQNDFTFNENIFRINCLHFSGAVFELLLENNFISALTVCFRKEYIDIENINKDQIIFAYDHFYWLRIAARSLIYFMNEKTACYRLHGDNFLFTGRIKTQQLRNKLYPAFILDSLNYFFVQKEKRLAPPINKNEIIFKKILFILFNKNIHSSHKKYLIKNLLQYFPGIKNSFLIIFKVIKNATKRLYYNV